MPDSAHALRVSLSIDNLRKVTDYEDISGLNTNLRHKTGQSLLKTDHLIYGGEKFDGSQQRFSNGVPVTSGLHGDDTGIED
ncbi:hypothetical protein [Vibrio quintilis]|nr:hypothetical protein [Vibrio quintilis]